MFTTANGGDQYLDWFFPQNSETIHRFLVWLGSKRLDDQICHSILHLGMSWINISHCNLQQIWQHWKELRKMMRWTAKLLVNRPERVQNDWQAEGAQQSAYCYYATFILAQYHHWKEKLTHRQTQRPCYTCSNRPHLCTPHMWCSLKIVRASNILQYRNLLQSWHHYPPWELENLQLVKYCQPVT